MLMHIFIVIVAEFTYIVVRTFTAVIARADNGLGLTDITYIVLVNCDHIVDLVNQFFLAASF